MRTREELTEWAEDHGYYHWKCRDCGRSGWTDTTPDCDCREDYTIMDKVRDEAVND